MSVPKDSEVFTKLIALLEEAASCSRQLAFLREQQMWLKVDENILFMRRTIILIAEQNQQHAGRLIRPN